MEVWGSNWKNWVDRWVVGKTNVFRYEDITRELPTYVARLFEPLGCQVDIGSLPTVTKPRVLSEFKYYDEKAFKEAEDRLQPYVGEYFPDKLL